jgi:hypothetical protein
MATNEILRFAETDTGTNLLTQAEYLADSQRPIGNQPGVARSKLVNKALRQASLIAAGVAEFLADNQANNITDGLTPQDIADYMAAVVRSLGIPTAVAGGTADVITADFTPNVSLTNGTTVIVRATAANATTTPTFSPDGLTAKTIVKGNNLPLSVGDIAGAGHWLEMNFDLLLDKWVLQNPFTQVSFASDAETQAGVITNKAVTPAGMKSAQIQLGTAVNVSGTAIDFTNIPSWVKRIYILFNGVSTNGGSPRQVQLGSGTLKTSGYSGAATGASSAVSTINASTGLLVENATANTENSFGLMTISHMGGNKWVATSVRGQTGTAATAWAGCAVDLTGVLDRLRITTINGTDVFDSGSLNISWE